MTDLTLIKAQLKPQEEEAKGILEVIRDLDISSQQNLDEAQSWIGEIKSKWNAIEAQRTKITKPMNEALTAANAIFQPALKYLKECENLLKAKTLEGEKKLRQLQTEALQKLAANAKAGDMEGARAAMLDMPTATLASNTSVRKTWEVELDDLTKVEEKYLTLEINWTLVKADIKNGLHIIPGFRIYQKESLAYRGSK